MGGQNKLRWRAREEMTGKHDRYRSTIFHDFMDMYLVLWGLLSSLWFILLCFVEHVRSKLSAQWTSGTIRLLEAKRKRNKQKQGWLVADGDPLCFEKPNVGYYYFSPFLWNSRKCLILIAMIFYTGNNFILLLSFFVLSYLISLRKEAIFPLWKGDVVPLIVIEFWF